jgi:hypothetical protein
MLTLYIPPDDESAQTGVSESLGSIAALLYTVDKYVLSDLGGKFLAVKADDPVHEKASKAFVHRVG